MLTLRELKRIRVFPTLGHSSCGQSAEVNTSLGKMVITGNPAVSEKIF